MSKFKVGDKVEIFYEGFEPGVFAEVVAVDSSTTSSFPVKVRTKTGSEGWYKKSELRLVPSSTPEEHTGGSSSYYDIEVGGSTVRCLDIIEALDMSFNEGNIFKAVWRIAAAKQGKTKKGNNMFYDSEKICFFGERLMKEHKEDV